MKEKKEKVGEFNVSKYMETEDYRLKNETIKNEINLHKVEIDRSVFIKTNLEKLNLKKIKKSYNNFNGDKLSFFAALKELQFTFGKMKTPNWGSFKYNDQLINTI